MKNLNVHLGLKTLGIYVLVVSVGIAILLQLACLAFVFCLLASHFLDSDFFVETCRIIQSLAVDSPKAQVMEPAEPVEPPKELHLGVEIVFMGAIASLTFIILSVALSSWGVDPTVLNEVDPLILNSILERLLDQREFLMEVAKNLKEIDEFGKKNNYHHLPSNLLLGIPH